MQKAKSTGVSDYAIIFDIQRFSLHDGPGIRTTVFFKGCPIECAWCQNPESHKTRPEIAFYAEHCKKSYNCENICPNNAIVRGAEQRVDYTKCNSCGDCAEYCDFNALRIIGKEWYCDTLIEELMKDEDYFIDSGGGVTLSGGEPMMQVEFLEKFLPLLKAQGIHVNMETCGVFKWERIEKIIPYLDLIYYDLKHMNPVTHKRYTKLDNKIILQNFEKLAKVFLKLQTRMPIIPGINDSQGNISAVAQFLKQNKQKSIHCLPYHNLGEAKLTRINSNLKPFNSKSISAKDIEPIKIIFEKKGIHVVIYN